jgi:hypothetical protein
LFGLSTENPKNLGNQNKKPGNPNKYSVGKHKGFFLATFKYAIILNDIADPNYFETKFFLANIV